MPRGAVLVHHADPPVKFLLNLCLLVALSALAGAAWVAHRPGTLPPVEPPRPGARQRELVDDLKQAAIKRSAVFEISEAEINRHLAKTLTARMARESGQVVHFERLAVKLEPDKARLILAWNLKGHLSTAEVDFRINRQDQAFRAEVVGGAYGHLRVPHGLLRPLNPALEKLAKALREEIQALFQMNQIQIAQDKLVLDPRFP